MTRICLLVAGAAIVLVAAGCQPWIVNAAPAPVDRTGYEVEDLPVVITASFARGDDVYLGLESGELKRASDARFREPWDDLGRPIDGGPRLVFASRTGTLFVSADRRPVHRSDDAGRTWEACLAVPVWRVEEDDEGSLYAGNYTKDDEHSATLYQSTDDGATWAAIFEEPAAHHIHTVRWDERGQRLYIAFGDGPGSGRAYSDDRGASFVRIPSGPQEVCTDVAFTRDYVFWCTDTGTGRILRVARATGAVQTITGWSQFVWFGVAEDEQVFLGTVASQKLGGERAALWASHDQGASWQKLSETARSNGPYSQGFFGESRRLSAGGWLYCTGGDENGPRSYRVRRVRR